LRPAYLAGVIRKRGSWIYYARCLHAYGVAKPKEDKATPFGRYLKSLREQRMGENGRKLAQRGLDARLGAAVGYIGQLESGAKPPPSRSRIEEIGSALGANRDELEQLLRLAGHLRPGEKIDGKPRATMEVYLRGDPDLTDAQRAVLLSTYNELVKANRGRSR
jgi:hypothetical protein